jgi:hypothetical protein
VFERFLPETPHPSWLLTIWWVFWRYYAREADAKAKAMAVGMLLRSGRSKSHRGTELLDELAQVLPNLYGFDKESDWDCAAIITLLHRYWGEMKYNLEKDEIKLRSDFINVLNRMVTLYRETNVPLACGVMIVASYVESSYLKDEEARLVHSITGIHIDRAASLMNIKSTAA